MEGARLDRQILFGLLLLITSGVFTSAHFPELNSLRHGFSMDVLALEHVQNARDANLYLGSGLARQSRLDKIGTSIHFDFIFILAYGLWFVLMAQYFVGHKLVPRISLYILVGLACLSDIIENILLLSLEDILQGSRANVLINHLQHVANFKFMMVFSAIILLAYYARNNGVVRKIVSVLGVFGCLLYQLAPLVASNCWGLLNQCVTLGFLLVPVLLFLFVLGRWLQLLYRGPKI